MIKRYSRKELANVEVAPVEAMEKLGQIPRGVASIV